MSTTCKYCNEPENKQEQPGLICECCISFVHLSCLQRPGTPGDFSCDVFFDFTCEDCSPSKKEVFVRNRFPWVNVILLTLHHLNENSHGISNHGFFHYKTHICSFIDRNWTLLFGTHFKQKKNWVGTIAGSLSVYNNLLFQSGSVVLGETGWWRLLHAFSPPVAAHIVQEMARDKPKGRPRNLMALDRTLFIAKVTEMGYEDLVSPETTVFIPGAAVAPAAPAAPVAPVAGGAAGVGGAAGAGGAARGRKRRRTPSSDQLVHVQYYDNQQFKTDSVEESLLQDPISMPLGADGIVYSDVDSLFRGFEFTPANYVPPSDSSSIHSLQQSAVYYDSDSRSGSPSLQQPPEKDQSEPDKPEKPKRPVEDKPITRRETLFSDQLNSVDLPWEEKLPECNKELVPMTEYEEVQLLKQVENLIPKVKDPNKKAHLCRLKAKLALRRLKRHKHLPVFDLDKTVKVLAGYRTEDPKVVMNAERVLDRFQRSYLLDNLCGTIASATYGTVLLSHIEPTPFRSPYSCALLKPFIRRDYETTPLRLQLMDELLRKTNRRAGYTPPPHASLDYSYVRPQHLAAVNALAANFFWPGIDLSEALQYPEFSCVVTYRKLVVAFAFLVPDTRRGDAYISFVLVRPHWRNARIATFMLYHLLQTCTHKDVTLHVSPTNPAIFLYQKFGFKVEELVQDFYEKYFDIDYKGCRHALFLRLVR